MKSRGFGALGVRGLESECCYSLDLLMRKLDPSFQSTDLRTTPKPSNTFKLVTPNPKF